ncbi:MAG: hypothetical protein BA869_09705 [Desulfuromonadales bacterium C00003107]|jgi:hypothetical protein|nr:MAG: hypothetical protein BA869_09705 [Desulfuromonadales bacterium C00003107]
MPSPDGKKSLQASADSSRTPLDRWLVRLITAVAVVVGGSVLFLMIGGMWGLAFLAFAVVLWRWGEDHILPWMFFIVVAGGLVWLIANLLGYSL